MNAINVIYPYRDLDLWVFDDEARGLAKEPFVEDANAVIDLLTAGIPDAASGFRLMFSAEPFPGFQHAFTWLSAELSGNVYQLDGANHQVWLCPALLKYFDSAPAKLFAKIDPKPPLRADEVPWRA